MRNDSDLYLPAEQVDFFPVCFLLKFTRAHEGNTRASHSDAASCSTYCQTSHD